MPTTLLQKWSNAFEGDSPDTQRSRTSGGVNSIRNTLSDAGLGMNNWNSKSPIPSTRHTQKIGLLWDTFLNPNAPDASFGNGGNVTDPLLNNVGAMDTQFDSKTHGDKKTASNNIVQAVIKQNNIRVTGVAEAFVAFAKGNYDDFFAAADKIRPATTFVKNNYRLAAADPNGNFSIFTDRAMADSVTDYEDDTISLEDFRALQ